MPSETGSSPSHCTCVAIDRVELWNAINAYVRACGGDPAKHVYGNAARMDAVVRVEKAVSTRGEAAADDKLARYLSLADRVFQIAESMASAETKYELIFSADLSCALSEIFRLEYYDPDTTCEEDVAAYVLALRDKCADLRKSGVVP